MPYAIEVRHDWLDCSDSQFLRGYTVGQDHEIKMFADRTSAERALSGMSDRYERSVFVIVDLREVERQTRLNEVRLGAMIEAGMMLPTGQKWDQELCMEVGRNCLHGKGARPWLR